MGEGRENDDALGHKWSAVYDEDGMDVGSSCTVCGELNLIGLGACPDENGGVHVFNHLEDQDSTTHTIACACGQVIIVPHTFINGECECGWKEE